MVRHHRESPTAGRTTSGAAQPAKAERAFLPGQGRPFGARPAEDRLAEDRVDRRAFVGAMLSTVAAGSVGLRWLAGPGLGSLVPLVAAANDVQQERSFEPLSIPREAWRRRLTTERFEILFEEGTERAGSSPLNAEKREGTYVCAACRLPLFASEAKFESGTGWPSFTAPLPGRIDTKRDFKLLFPRTEYHCARCGGHQGHVFEDGPPPTGQRWCNNGLALRFVPKGEPLPALVSEAKEDS